MPGYIISIFIGIIHFILHTSCWQFGFGDCPVFYKEPCTQRSIKFYLSYTTKGELKQQNLDPFYPKLPKLFNVESELKIVIHGYGGLSVDSGTTNVTAAYQQKKYNVITVDWEYLAHLPCYATAFLNTWHVAQCTTILIVSLISNGILLKNIHLVGFSMGAHIAGFTGDQLQTTAGMKLSRITGLDPALPLFATLDNHWKLDSGDAEFVDVVHTNALTFGKLEPSGHVDFYMNGGMLQPFCKNRPYPPLCSHILAGLYFAESILSERRFIGTECKNFSPTSFLNICTNRTTAVMGEHVSKLSRGLYYVNTAEKPPFALDTLNTTYSFYK